MINQLFIKQLSDRNVNQWFKWNFKISCISQINDSKCYKWDEEIRYLSKMYNFKPVYLITVSFDANRRVQIFLISINSEHYHKERLNETIQNNNKLNSVTDGKKLHTEHFFQWIFSAVYLKSRNSYAIFFEKSNSFLPGVIRFRFELICIFHFHFVSKWPVWLCKWTANNRSKNTNNRMKSSIVWDCCHFSKVSYQTHLISCFFFVIVVASLCSMWHFKSWKYFDAYMYLCSVYVVVVDIGVFFSSLDTNGDEYKVNFTNCTSRINVSSHKYTVGGMKVHANNIDPII